MRVVALFVAAMSGVEGSCLHHAQPNQTPAGRSPKPQLDAAFATWHKQQREVQLMQREVNRLSHPDVPLWLIFEGIAQPTVIAGSARMHDVHLEAARLHNLDADQKLRLVLEGAALPLGVAISESPLANTKNQKVHIQPCEWPVKRARMSVSGRTVRAGAGIPATRARGDARPRPPPKHQKAGGVVIY